jgi:hypothetical protein
MRTFWRSFRVADGDDSGSVPNTALCFFTSMPTIGLIDDGVDDAVQLLGERLTNFGEHSASPAVF